MFNSSLEKGTRKKGLPSPRIIDFDLLSSYDDVLDKAKDIFFPKEANDLNAYSLATSSGVAFDINKENWRLGDFLKDHSFQPSKVRFYILFNSNRVSHNYHFCILHPIFAYVYCFRIHQNLTMMQHSLLNHPLNLLHCRSLFLSLYGLLYGLILHDWPLHWFLNLHLGKLLLVSFVGVSLPHQLTG